MKFILMSLALLSFSAMACPDLSGSYLCDGVTEPMVVKTVVDAKGITTMSIDGLFTYRADGKKHTQIEGVNLKQGYQISTCKRGVLTSRTLIHMGEGGPVMKGLVTYRLDGDDLLNEVEVTLNGESSGVETNRCARVK